MSKLDWSPLGLRQYGSGLSHGVVYPKHQPAVSWSGLISVDPSNTAEVETYLLNGVKYGHDVLPGDYTVAVDAYAIPRDVLYLVGFRELGVGLYVAHQTRPEFGMVYRTRVSNPLSEELGYDLHILYNCTVLPGEVEYKTISDSPEPTIFRYLLRAVPPVRSDGKLTPYLRIRSTREDPAKLETLEDLLYGTDSTEPTLPTQDEVFAILD